MLTRGLKPELIVSSPSTVGGSKGSGGLAPRPHMFGWGEGVRETYVTTQQNPVLGGKIGHGRGEGLLRKLHNITGRVGGEMSLELGCSQ